MRLLSVPSILDSFVVAMDSIEKPPEVMISWPLVSISLLRLYALWPLVSRHRASGIEHQT